MYKSFVQVRTDSGTGLGLSISAALLNLMGGTYGVTSKYGEGSTFWFRMRLPVSDEPLDESSETNEPESDHKQSLYILITDDDMITRNLMTKILRTLGHTTDTAENGQVCIEKVQAASEENRRQYDVILLDNQMPVMNGKDTLKWLRSHNANINVISLTGVSDVDEQNELFQLGANFVLIKPVSMALIDKTLKRVVIQ
jgi:CheY-like chemotaxis protein